MRTLLALALVFCAAACDDSVSKETVTNNENIEDMGNDVIDFGHAREFSEIRVGGFNAANCRNPEDRSQMHFVMLADDNTAVRPGAVISGAAYEPSVDAFEFADATLYETPNVACDASCRVSGFECLSDPSLSEARCGLTTVNLRLNAVPQFVADTSRDQLFALVVEGSGSLAGFLPASVAAANVDSLVVSRERASDSQQRRLTAFTSLSFSFAAVQDAAFSEGRQTLFGVWEFAGVSTQGVVSRTAPLTPDGSFFSTTDFSQSLDLSEVEGTRANVYQAISSVLESMEDPSYTDFEKMMVVFVDGPDDLRLDSVTPDSLASRAQALGVQIWIAHLDRSTDLLSDSEKQRLFPDDPDYWRDGRQSPCSDDDACRNFEVCRVPQIDGSDDPQANGESYCMVNRTNVGQIGPIDEYSRLACETGGSYLYVNDARTLTNQMAWLPFALDGLWSAELTVDDPEQVILAGESYYLDTEFSATIGRTRRTHNMSRAGREAAVESAQDTRAILRY